MSATLAGFGFVPSYHPTGLDRGIAYSIAAAYATPIYKYGMCTLNTSGTITIAAVAADFLGVFNGVEWTDAQQKPNYSNFWPGTQTGATNITAWVWSTPDTVFTVQADGSLTQAAVGDQQVSVCLGFRRGIDGEQRQDPGTQCFQLGDLGSDYWTGRRWIATLAQWSPPSPPIQVCCGLQVGSSQRATPRMPVAT